jgi:hypothetical protein
VTHKCNRHAYFHLRFVCCLFLIASSMAQFTSQMPRIEGESLAGRKVQLPDAAAGRLAVLIFGFSKASKVPTSAWADRFQADFGNRKDFDIYQLPVLEDVPRLIRSMVISGIRKGVAENKRDHFVPVLQGEAELKRLVHYKEPDSAYLVVLGRDGNILETICGTPDDAGYARLHALVESALNQK